MRHTGSGVSRTQITSSLGNTILTPREKIRHAQLSKIHLFPVGKNTTPPFLVRILKELEQRDDRSTENPLDILEKLRGLSLDEIKILNRQLMLHCRRKGKTLEELPFQVSQLLLLEADPLFILLNDDLKQRFFGAWRASAPAAFQSLLRRNPKAAQQYFEKIPQQDLRSLGSPFRQNLYPDDGLPFLSCPKRSGPLFPTCRG